MEIYILDDIWNLIKTYIFHDIKLHGKHLKNDPDVKEYNNILKNLPKPLISRVGQSITYLRDKNRDVYTFKYYVRIYKNNFIPIIETMPIPKNYNILFKVYDYLIKFIYRNQYNMNKKTFNNTIYQFDRFLLK
tara:strand:- start:679 stop:1077 length:399 start_codon:yes stop_codon:yes gene_type:complete